MRYLITALFATVLLGACDGPADFRSPLSEPGAAPYDERLIGEWYALDEDEEGIALLVIEAGEEGLLDAAVSYMSVRPGDTGFAGLAWFNRTAYASVIDGQTYYNTRLVEGGLIAKDVGEPIRTEGGPLLPPNPELGYWIMRADIGDDGVLVLQVLTETLLKARNFPSREIDCGEDCGFTVYDLSPAELADLIRTEPDEDLFGIRMAFARFGSPPPPALD